MELKKLFERGYSLKKTIDEMTAELKNINLRIADEAEYKPGSKTGHILTPDIQVIVSRRENVKWNPEKLQSIKSHFSDRFDELVKFEIKPDARKIKQAGGEIERAFNWAKEITPAQPTVSYELIKEQEAA